MILHDDWRRIVRKAWSVKLLIVAGILSGCEVALPFIQPYVDVPPGRFALLAALTTCVAFIARIVAQKDFNAL